MKPEDVLELMGTAPQRYASVRAALQYGGDGPTLEALEQRYFESKTYRLEVEVEETGGAPETSLARRLFRMALQDMEH